MLGGMRPIKTFMAVLCLTVAGCHAWQVQPGPASSAAALAASDSTKAIRLTLKSGAVIDLSAVHVAGDSIRGISRSTGQPVAFAAMDVQSVALRQVSAGRTALATGGVILLGVAILGVLTAIALGGVMNGM